MADGWTIASIEPLDDSNYFLWKEKVEGVLRAKKLWKKIIGIKPPEKPKEGETQFEEKFKKWNDWDDDNYAARAIMVNSMSKAHLLKYSHEQCANRLWNLIKENMEAESEEMKIKSLSEMTNLKMNKEESVDEYMNRAEALKNQCEQLGKTIEDYELKMYVLRGLRVEFENNVRILESQRGKTMKDIRYSLKQEEARREKRKEEKIIKEKEGVRKVRDSSKREIHCYNCGKKGHKSAECHSKVKCFNCQKTGHISSDCREVRRQQSTRGRGQQGRYQGSYEMKRSEHGRKEETSMKTKDEAVMCTQDQKVE